MIHLVKLAVGIEDVGQLESLQRQRRRGAGRLYHRTRLMPRRAAEVTDGGSIYWVIKGQVRVRQRVTGIERSLDPMSCEDGRPATLLLLDPVLIRSLPPPCRAFQGWRYLEPGAAPSDLAAADPGPESKSRGGGLAAMPPEMLPSCAPSACCEAPGKKRTAPIGGWTAPFGPPI